jgi:hypothetical protein
MRFAVVTDIHHGGVSFTKQGPAACGLLRRMLVAAGEAGASAVVDLGDRISDIDAATDATLLTEVAAVFRESNLPRHHVDGNHDRCFLTAAENDAVLGRAGWTRAVDLGPVRAIFWQPDVTLTRTRPLQLGDGDLDALAAVLGTSDRRTLLFTHVPLSGASMAGNMWFENNHAHAAYAADQAAIRAVLAAAPCPIIAFAGHVHWNSLSVVDGVAHVTAQSLTESFTTGGEACGAWGLVDIDADTLTWRVMGADPIELRLPFPAVRPRWAKPLPSFAKLIA